MKELDEAREKLKQICWDNFNMYDGEFVFEDAVDQILSLKGNGWKIALVNHYTHHNQETGNLVDEWDEVIWPVGDEESSP